MKTLPEILSAYSSYLDSNPPLLRLARNNVGLEPIFDNDYSRGGLIIPDMAKERCTQGIVKCIGPEVEDIQIGDYCIFSGYNGDLLAYEDGLYIVMPETAIAARLSPDYNITLEEDSFGGPAQVFKLSYLIQSIKNSISEDLSVKSTQLDRDR